MATDLIRYDILVQNAFRDIFRKVMADVAVKGLPGEHHFLVTFRTGAAGVKISDRLRQAHPQDMTIVLQHQFWDLVVTDTGFSVGLSFKNVPEKLVVPYSAVTGFFDPSVNFGAEFTVEPVADAESTKPGTEKAIALASTRRTRGSGSEPTETMATDAGEKPAKPAGRKEPPPAVARDGKTNGDEKLAVQPGEQSDAPKVVSIDAFRKKT